METTFGGGGDSVDVNFFGGAGAGFKGFATDGAVGATTSSGIVFAGEGGGDALGERGTGDVVAGLLGFAGGGGVIFTGGLGGPARPTTTAGAISVSL